MLNKECEKIRLEMMPYLYGDLPEDEKLQIEAHVAFCDDCRLQLQDFRETLAQVDEATRQNDVLLPDGFISQKILSQGLLAQRPQQHLKRRRILYVMSMAASFLIGIITSYAVLRNFSVHDGEPTAVVLDKKMPIRIVIETELSEEDFQAYLASLDDNSITPVIQEASQMGYSPDELRPMLLKALIGGKPSAGEVRQEVHQTSTSTDKPKSKDEANDPRNTTKVV